MTQEEIIQAISDDKTMPFIQPEQLAEIVDFVIKNYNPFLDTLPEQPVEGLEEAAHNFALLYDNGTCDEIAQDCFIAGAEYQRKQDQSLIELAEDHAMLAGMNKMKEEMMEKAFRCEIIKSRTHMPHLKPYFFSSDYGKIGDKVRVIVIPEEE